MKVMSKEMRFSQRLFFITTIVFIVFIVFLIIITNLCISLYEAQENYVKTNTRLEALHSYFDKFTNISFPISYSLNFYENYHEMPVIYLITPTNNRNDVQLADLTRLRNTLWLVPKIVWILVEDSETKTSKISNFLAYSKLPYVHLSEKTPDDQIVQPNEKSWSKSRGVFQRNKALAWLRDNQSILDTSGVVYFADDDNTYDIRLFEEMRYTKKVSVWPVAFVGELLYEAPVCENDKVTGWFNVWGDNRPFPIDMAGFAVNVNLILAHPSARFSQFVKRGMQESHFLQNLVSINDLEPKADSCTKIYVWHTNTRYVLRAGEKYMDKKNVVYNQKILEQI